METRPLVIDDYDDVMQLWRACEGVGLSDADSREGIRKYLARNEGLSSVTHIDGELAGVIMAGHDGRRGFLHHLAVAPRFRGTGIGRALVESSLARLRACRIGKCHIMVYAGNEAARAFWSRLGWTRRDDVDLMSYQLE
jgi:putative acetyltransferase